MRGDRRAVPEHGSSPSRVLTYEERRIISTNPGPDHSMGNINLNRQSSSRCQRRLGHSDELVKVDAGTVRSLRKRPKYCIARMNAIAKSESDHHPLRAAFHVVGYQDVRFQPLAVVREKSTHPADRHDDVLLGPRLPHQRDVRMNARNIGCNGALTSASPAVHARSPGREEHERLVLAARRTFRSSARTCSIVVRTTGVVLFVHCSGAISMER